MTDFIYVDGVEYKADKELLIMVKIQIDLRYKEK